MTDDEWMPRFFSSHFARLPGRARRGLWLGLAMLAVLVGWPGWAWDTQRLEQAAAALGGQAPAQAQALRALVADLTSRDEAVRVAAVNDFFNRRVQYRSDMEVWGLVDYWASPLEMLSRSAGDCEDFAIAKYFTLVSTGISHKKLRLVYVRARFGGLVQPHMVLAYYPTPDADPWVLDSLVQDLQLASSRPDLSPVFSFNAESVWEGVGATRVSGSAGERLSPWAAVMKKARAEGF